MKLAISLSIKWASSNHCPSTYISIYINMFLCVYVPDNDDQASIHWRSKQTNKQKKQIYWNTKESEEKRKNS